MAEQEKNQVKAEVTKCTVELDPPVAVFHVVLEKNEMACGAKLGVRRVNSMPFCAAFALAVQCTVFHSPPC
jgi:hypothetical protein